MPNSLLGHTLGKRYRFDELLGEGSFAHVYRITDLHRRATLAAKVLRPDIAQEPTFLERFRREASVLASLQHPNIVRFYDIVEAGSAMFILMDYIPGLTLEMVFRRQGGPIKPAASLVYLTPLAAALHFAHNEGVIHRDLKPGNILIHENGTLFVTDFGIARVLNIVSELTAGTTLGTPFYMAPEQITGPHITPAADIYALGILLYRMYTGQVPFRGESGTGTTPATRITYEHVHQIPEAPKQLNPDLSLAVQEVILRCLEKDPAQRYATVSDLYDALAEAIGAPPISLEDPHQTGQYPPIPPDMKLPEWSQFIKPVPEPHVLLPDASEEDDTGPVVVPGLEAEQPESQRATEPHLEDQLESRGAARTLFSFGRRIIPTTQPHLFPPSRLTPPPSHASAPARRRRQGLGVIVAGGLLLLASLCIAALYLSGVFNTTTNGNPTPDSQVTNDTPAPSQNHPSGTRIAFDSGRNGTQDIFIMNLDGTDLQQVTGMSGAERGPAWSPDGTRIAFYGASSEQGTYDIYVINVDGADMRNITNTASVDERYPTWSPDGLQLAFHSNADGDWDIYIIRLDGTGLRAVTNNSADDLGPDWSPEGTQIAYHTDVWGAPYEIAVVNLNSLDVRRVTSSDDANTFPTWSPDGTRLAYTVIDADDNATNISVIKTDGTAVQVLTNIPTRDSFPDWSPDGTRIIYQSGEPGESGIFVIPAEGGDPEALTGRQANFLPEWEPVY